MAAGVQANSRAVMPLRKRHERTALGWAGGIGSGRCFAMRPDSSRCAGCRERRRPVHRPWGPALGNGAASCRRRNDPGWGRVDARREEESLMALRLQATLLVQGLTPNWGLATGLSPEVTRAMKTGAQGSERSRRMSGRHRRSSTLTSLTSAAGLRSSSTVGPG